MLTWRPNGQLCSFSAVWQCSETSWGPSQLWDEAVMWVWQWMSFFLVHTLCACACVCVVWGWWWLFIFQSCCSQPCSQNSTPHPLPHTLSPPCSYYYHDCNNCPFAACCFFFPSKVSIFTALFARVLICLYISLLPHCALWALKGEIRRGCYSVGVASQTGS